MWLPSMAYIHLVAGVLLTGYACSGRCWPYRWRAIRTDRRSNGCSESHSQPAGRIVVPLALRLPLPVVRWTFLVATALTGVVLLAGVPFSGMLLGKLSLFAILLGASCS